MDDVFLAIRQHQRSRYCPGETLLFLISECSNRGFERVWCLCQWLLTHCWSTAALLPSSHSCSLPSSSHRGSSWDTRLLAWRILPGWSCSLGCSTRTCWWRRVRTRSWWSIPTAGWWLYLRSPSPPWSGWGCRWCREGSPTAAGCWGLGWAYRKSSAPSTGTLGPWGPRETGSVRCWTGKTPVCWDPWVVLWLCLQVSGTHPIRARRKTSAPPQPLSPNGQWQFRRRLEAKFPSLAKVTSTSGRKREAHQLHSCPSALVLGDNPISEVLYNFAPRRRFQCCPSFRSPLPHHK